MSFNLGSSMMESMFSLNQTEAGFTLPKPVTEAPFAPIFSPEEDITANSSATETVNEILNDPLLEDHHVVPETPEDTNSNDRSSTTPTKLKNKRLTEKRCKRSNTIQKNQRASRLHWLICFNDSQTQTWENNNSWIPRLGGEIVERGTYCRG